MLQIRPSSDLHWMRRALHLAEQMRGHVWPNPPVGCVIVKDGHVVGEAATHVMGRPHAERKALDRAGGEARGTRLFVTLEPCCHWGKTPPCTDAIIDAGVAQVVCAVKDPDPRVNGGGFEKLRAAGVGVSVGLCADEAESLLSGFFHRVRHGAPEVVVVERPTKRIPYGVDALISSSFDGMRLHARKATKVEEIAIPKNQQNDVLRWLGKLGLTTVAVPRGDTVLGVIAGPDPGSLRADQYLPGVCSIVTETNS